MLQLNEKEIIGLYLHMKGQYDLLDDTLIRFYNKLESLIFEKLSIEQLENLDKLYQTGFCMFE